MTASLDAIKDAAERGLTREEAAAEAGVSYTTIHNYSRKYGIRFNKRFRGRGADERAQEMASLFRAGYTMNAIGEQYGITRERVRQIITRNFGMTAEHGGRSVGAADRAERRAAKLNAQSIAKRGCTLEQYHQLRDMVKPTRAYSSQRSNAHKRGIEWKFNLWTWWQVWQASGKWDQRGRGQGYVMCRINDEGPYAPGNVFIALAAENSSSRKGKTSGLPMGVSRKARGAYIAFAANRSINGKKHYIGSFKTPELAYAAYLAAAPKSESEAA